MSLAIVLAIIMLIVVIVALFYAPPAPYSVGLNVVGAVCALLLFLMAVGVLHL